MKVSREQVLENRRRILEVAARLFRLRGADGVSVAEVMQGAGLTHGAFYGYFDSKDDLLAHAFDNAAQAAAAPWSDAARRAYIERYLSTAHRDDPGNGCAYAALSQQASREDGLWRRVMSEGLDRFLQRLTQAAPGASDAERRSNAAADIATMVGAIVLARLASEPALSETFLSAARHRLDVSAAAD